MTTPRGPGDKTTSSAADPLVRALDGVGAAIGVLAEESRAERAARDEETRAERKDQARRDKRTVWLLCVVVFLVAVIGALVVDNRLRSGASRQILRTIEDCTAADGDCYARNQRKTAEVLAEVSADAFDTAWCVKVSDTRPAAVRCIVEARKARAGK